MAPRVIVVGGGCKSFHSPSADSSPRLDHMPLRPLVIITTTILRLELTDCRQCPD